MEINFNAWIIPVGQEKLKEGNNFIIIWPNGINNIMQLLEGFYVCVWNERSRVNSRSTINQIEQWCPRLATVTALLQKKAVIFAVGLITRRAIGLANSLHVVCVIQ